MELFEPLMRSLSPSLEAPQIVVCSLHVSSNEQAACLPQPSIILSLGKKTLCLALAPTSHDRDLVPLKAKFYITTQLSHRILNHRHDHNKDKERKWTLLSESTRDIKTLIIQTALKQMRPQLHGHSCGQVVYVTACC